MSERALELALDLVEARLHYKRILESDAYERVIGETANLMLEIERSGGPCPTKQAADTITRRNLDGEAALQLLAASAEAIVRRRLKDTLQSIAAGGNSIESRLRPARSPEDENSNPLNTGDLADGESQ